MREVIFELITTYGVDEPYFDDIISNQSADMAISDIIDLMKYRLDSSNIYSARIKATALISKIAEVHAQENEILNGDVLALVECKRYEEALDSTKNMLPFPFAIIAKVTDLLTYEMLESEVTKLVRDNIGNRWIFRIADVDDTPLKIVPKLLEKINGKRSIFVEKTAVRLDFTHSGWSDIFFLSTDFPEGAKVINMAIDLCEYKEKSTKPPITVSLRVIDKPVLRLKSVDLNCEQEISDFDEMFRLKDCPLSILKAAVIAAGLVPPFINSGKNQSFTKLLEYLIGKGMGLEIVSSVDTIPPNSRLAVSTNLLASIITLLMRATNQITIFEGELVDATQEKLIMSRVTLAEWLGGSSGGWQDTGGILGGVKAFSGELSDVLGGARGKLLPQYERLCLKNDVKRNLLADMVLVHGGMSINVSNTLKDVTNKYLVREKSAATARKGLIEKYAELQKAILVCAGKEIAAITDSIFSNELQEIIPYVTNKYTETIRENMQKEFGNDYYGFMMIGGLSGGGMVFWVNGEQTDRYKRVESVLLNSQCECEGEFDFVSPPIVYNFEINEKGTVGFLKYEE